MDKNKNEEEAVRTLGILLVHGIGMQRRGETLVVVGSALCKWVAQFLRLQRTEVPVLDASLTLEDTGNCEPPNASISFRDADSVSTLTWKLAESHWAESFPAATFVEFARWSLRILPIAILLHLAPPIRASIEYTKARKEIESNRGLVSLATVFKVLDDSDLASRNRLLQDFGASFDRSANQAIGQAVANFLLLPFYAIAVLSVQLIMLLLLMVAWLPFEFIANLAKRIQTTLSATLGDSCLFTTNPVIESAIVSKVQRDIEKLAVSCDQVVVIAHSQGAAVAYQAIEQWGWRKKLPEQLKLLITYGSGLQKLLDLRIPADLVRTARVLGLLAQISSTGLAVLTIYFICLFGTQARAGYIGVAGIAALICWVGFWLASIGIAVNLDTRARLLEIDWDVYYASHDPVSNGRTYLSKDETGSKGRFYERMRRVVNFGSTLWDHTTYWKNVEEFTARVVVSLFERSKVQLHWLTPEWLDVCAARRSWRVQYLSACRAVALISMFAVTLLAWPHLNAIGAWISEVSKSVAAALQDVPDVGQSKIKLIPNGVIGEIAVLSCVVFSFAIARIGWAIWNSHEVEISFWRVGFTTSKVGVLLFAIGWIACMAAPLCAFVAIGDEPISARIELGTAIALILYVTVESLRTGLVGPGSIVPLATAGLEVAEAVIRGEKPIDKKDLGEAAFRFRSAAILLCNRGNSEVNTRALQGWEEALGLVGGTWNSQYDDLQKYANLALTRVRRKKMDDSGIVAMLTRLSQLKAQQSAPTEKK